ncbi:headcase protein homolog [Anneissia japonica]|uniref:headcase protein homolog n=1 Tax=Anneissia japonica TaxID=1529436 RepID=UPI001425734D|nr:headcase protein homolog [Anneissia japonica]
MPFTKEEKARQRAEQFREVNNNDAEEEDPDYKSCCVPSGCIVGEAVHIRNPDVVMKVVCNNKDCTYGVFMHKVCFTEWEESVLTYLRSSGRARSWSEKQRRQNLWTKKGYDLAWKACSCQCGKGHLRKDLDWVPPQPLDVDTQRKKTKKKKSNDKPTIGRATSLQQNIAGQANNGSHNHIGPAQSNGHHSGNSGTSGHNGRLRHTSGASVSSTDSFSSTPPTSADEFLYSPGPSPRISNGHIRLESNSSDRSWSPNNSQPANNQTSQRNSRSFSFSRSNSLNKEPIDNAPQQSPKTVDNLNDCLFLRRMDLSTFFEVLPRHKLNPYHIKMDEDGFAANEEIRKFIFNTMVLHKATSMACSMCARHLPIFDRYPLIDGTCYLTPVKHSDTNLQVNLNGKLQYLGAVCMLCLEGVHSVLCRQCKTPWDGSHHQLGTLYSYDIFAASPCCSGRVGCKQCGKPVIELSRGPFFFSQYSQTILCPHCGVLDFHFIKPLSSYEVRANQSGHRLIC